MASLIKRREATAKLDFTIDIARHFESNLGNILKFLKKPNEKIKTCVPSNSDENSNPLIRNFQQSISLRSWYKKLYYTNWWIRISKSGLQNN